MNSTVMNIFTKRILTAAGIAAMVAFFGSCAKETSVNSVNTSKEFFDAWMSVNHPGISPTGLGVYITEDIPGTGAALTDDDIVLFAEYTITDLEGSITSTTQESLAKQLGTYSLANYYGTDILINDRGYTETGVLEMVKGMKVGGKRTASIPSWLYTIADYDTEEKYIKANGGSNAICTVSLKGKTTDIEKWEIDTLRRYVALHMDGVDSTKFGYYSKTLVEPTDTATFSSDTSFYINYTGRLLNGKVFDTTIEDTAKVYGIYSSDKTYGPMYVTMAPEYANITISASSAETGNTTIDGFAFCLSRMHPMEKVRCAFYSTLGYGMNGEGSSIPKFAPLVFEVEAVASPEEDLL